jgi:hypothetical protein
MSWKKISVVLSVIVLCLCIAGFTGRRLIHGKTPDLTVEVYRVDDNGYGYKIIRGERLFIVQPFIPGIPGEQRFRTSEDARRVGELVLERLESGQICSITPEDLDQLGIKSFTKYNN